MMNNAITIIKSLAPNRVCKQFSIDEAGNILKRSVASVTEGEATLYEVNESKNMVSLLEFVTSKKNLVLCNGYFHKSEQNQKFIVVPEKVLAKKAGSQIGKVDGGVHNINGELVAARVKRGIDPSAWVLLDFDEPAGFPEHWKGLDIQGRLELLEPLIAGISQVERIELFSSSARVVFSDKPSKIKSHAWIRVNEPAKIAILKAHLSVMSVTQGISFKYEKLSRLTQGKVTGIEHRTVIDLATLDTGRLIFNAEPDLDIAGATLRGAEPVIINEGAGVLDISHLALPSNKELKKYKETANISLSMSMTDNGSLSIISEGQLTMDTEVTSRGVTKTLREWLPNEPFDKIRCESPFRESVSEAGFIKLGKNGKPFIHDIGCGVTYHLKSDALPSPIKLSKPDISDLFLIDIDSIDSIERSGKKGDGRIISASHTLLDAINQMPIHYDAFTDGMMVKTQDGEFRKFQDSFYTQIRASLERQGFSKISEGDIKSTVRAVAQSKNHIIDSALDWAGKLKWDGVKRCHRLFSDYFGAEDNEVSTAFSMYVASSMGARVLKAEALVDMVVVLVGEQGVGKTQSVKALSPSKETFAEIDLSAKDADLARQLKGKLVVELAELQGLRSRDSNHIKKWVSTQEDEWRPIYQENMTTYKRRCVMLATTNESGFLSDHTGNRRWLPLDIVTEGKPDAITEDRDQLWAEAITIFQEHGVIWEKAQSIGNELHSDYFGGNEVVFEAVKEWIDQRRQKFTDTSEVVLAEIADDLFQERATDIRLQKEIGNALKILKYEKRRINLSRNEDGMRSKKKVWIRQDSL